MTHFPTSEVDSKFFRAVDWKEGEREKKRMEDVEWVFSAPQWYDFTQPDTGALEDDYFGAR
jgi:hypothetical protein